MTETQTTQAPEQQAPQERVSWGTKVNYGIGTTGRSVANGFTGRLQYYTTTIIGMHHEHVAPLMIFGQAFDGLSDLMMGTVIDNTRSRWGKFRPWWALGTLLNALVTVGLFGVPGSLAAVPASWMTVTYVAFMWVMWDLTYTLVDVSYWSMLPALSPPGKERDIVSTVPRVAGGVFGVATAFNMNISSMLGGGGWNWSEATSEQLFVGFRYFAIFASVVYLITSMYGAVMVRELRIALPTEKKEAIGFGKALRILWNNKQTLTIVVVMILFNLGQNMSNGASIFFFGHVLREADTEFGIFQIAWGLASGIGMFAFPLASKHLGRRRFYKIAFVLPVISCAGMFLFHQFMPGVFVPFLLSMVVGSIGYGVMGVMQNVMLADSVDYGEWKTGQRNEGILFCTLTMLSKLAGLLSNAVGIGTQWTIRFGGRFGVPAVLSAFQVNGIKLWMFGFSPIALAVSYTVYKLFFQLHPERMAEIQAELAQRKAMQEALDGIAE